MTHSESVYFEHESSAIAFFLGQHQLPHSFVVDTFPNYKLKQFFENHERRVALFESYNTVPSLQFLNEHDRLPKDLQVQRE